MVVVAVSIPVTWWFTELAPIVLLGAGVAYLVGVPLSWGMGSWRHPPVITGHLLAGAVVGALVAVGFVLLDGTVAWWALYAMFAIPIGGGVAALAAWVAIALPARAVWPAALVGLMVTSLVLPTATWLDLRPPARDDYLLVQQPAPVRDRVAGPVALAELVAAGLDTQVARGAPRLARETWLAVSDELLADELAGAAT